MALFHQGEVWVVLSHLNGGQLFSKALEQTLGLDATQSEQYKRTYGLDASQLEGKVRTGLLIVLDNIVNEIRKGMEYHLFTHKTKVAKIVLSGGGVYLPQLTTHLSEIFSGIEVVIGDPFGSAKPGRGGIVIPREKAVYTVAIGLSQRVF